MNQNELIDALKERTAGVPPGARARVWDRLGQPRAAASRRPVFAFAGALALGFALVVGTFAWRHQPAPATAPTSQTFLSDGFALVTRPGAHLTPRGPGAFELSEGGVAASAWGEKLSVVAAHKTVTTEAARFTLEVAGESVVVAVNEGAVFVEGERVDAPRRWPGGAVATVDDALVRAQEPPGAADDRAYRLAEEAAARGDADTAIAGFGSVARHEGLRAEAALLRQGQLLLWNRHDPSRALEVLDEGSRRFPQGSLAQDTALSRLEALAALHRPDLAGAAHDFLTRFPDSERRGEVCRLGQLEKCER